jgi:beta-amylase
MADVNPETSRAAVIQDRSIMASTTSASEQLFAATYKVPPTAKVEDTNSAETKTSGAKSSDAKSSNEKPSETNPSDRKSAKTLDFKPSGTPAVDVVSQVEQPKPHDAKAEVGSPKPEVLDFTPTPTISAPGVPTSAEAKSVTPGAKGAYLATLSRSDSFQHQNKLVQSNSNPITGGLRQPDYRTSFAFDNFKPPEPPKSLLEHNINRGTSKVFTDPETLKQVNHYSAEFLKTASLFASPKIGMYSAVALYGLDNVKTNQDLVDGTIDFSIGGAKGATLRSLFSYSARNLDFLPSKGVAMGAISRGAEVVFSREMFTDPATGIAKLKMETLNPAVWMYDGATFVAAEGLFGVANKMTGNALKRSRLAGGMSMGASGGVVNGGTGEIIRQQQAKEDFDITKVLKHAALDGGVAGLGAGFGIKASDPKFYKAIGERAKNLDVTAKNLLENAGVIAPIGRRDFVVTGDKTSINMFSRGEARSATAAVREVKKVLFFDKQVGPERTLEISHNRPEPQVVKMSLIAGKTILANCNPELLPAELRNHHAFPDAKGPITLDSNGQGKIRLIADNTYKLDPATYKSLGQMTQLARPQITMNLMAPLAVGNMENPKDPANKEAWEQFDRDLAAAKKAGVDGISVDVWWGLVEPKPGQYRFPYYDKVFDHIRDHGLKAIPIISMHQCGGNIGDNVFVPIPFWIWPHLSQKAGSNNPDYAKYRSEQGNNSPEYVSAWATPLALPRYKALMEAFQEHFKNRRNDFSEINVSLGPAGEIRYPSYNSHDQNTGYPTRGALQSYSEAAVKSFRDFAVAKYGSEAKAKEAWGDPKAPSIVPPQTPNQFFANSEHKTSQYGKDFFDWYNGSLIQHGKLVLGTAVDVFGHDKAPFNGIDIGAKVPGVHWRVGEQQGNTYVPGDRLAELNAGLIRTSRGDWASDAEGHGYRPMMQMFRDVQRPTSKSKVVPHFTALELADGQDGPGVKSMPKSLATWVGQESGRHGLTLKGENALSFTLADPASWSRMRSFLALPENQNGNYYGLTLLRLGGEVLNTEVGRTRLAETIQAIRAANEAAAPQAEAK